MSKRRSTPKRPIGVTLIAAVQAVNALTLAMEFAVLTEDPTTPYRLPGEPGFAPLLFIALGLATSVGLWTLQRWAWVATMLWAGLAMLVSLHAYFNGNTVSYPNMAVTLLQVFYLNLREVQSAFERNRAPEVSVG